MAKKDYIQLVSDITGDSYEASKAAMDNAVSRLQITYKEYFDNKFYERSYVQQSLAASKIIRKRERTNERFNMIVQETNLSEKKIHEDIREINKKDIVKISSALYAKYELYKYTGDELDNRLHLIATRNALRSELQNKLIDIDNNELTYDDIQTSLDQFYSVIRELITEKNKRELFERLTASHPDLVYGSEECQRMVIDIEVTRLLLKFTITEYIVYHFSRKELPEKRAFLTDKERSAILNTLNDSSKFDLLDNKYESYNLLKKYYRRKMIYIASDKDYFKFWRFCKFNKTIVCKPPFDRMGRGIKCISITRDTNLRELFNELLQEYSDVVLEELIKPHPDIKCLNPDSVNTVRIVTYYKDGETTIHLPFMKVGRAGSFVDNGGAGGILISVDPETGILSSDGIDEAGVIYEKHPDTGIKFNGYRLPDWNGALNLAHELSSKVPGISYIGWDMTFTESGKWIVVEGNAKTQFFGQQAPSNTGARMDLINTVGYKTK